MIIGYSLLELANYRDYYGVEMLIGDSIRSKYQGFLREVCVVNGRTGYYDKMDEFTALNDTGFQWEIFSGRLNDFCIDDN